MIIRLKCQPQVLADLHTGHHRIVKIKGLAQTHAWWPGIDEQIEELFGNCGDCQGIHNQPSVVPLHTDPGHQHHGRGSTLTLLDPLWVLFFVIVDSHPKWFEVVEMETTTTEWTLDIMRSLFAR